MQALFTATTGMSRAFEYLFNTECSIQIHLHTVIYHYRSSPYHERTYAIMQNMEMYLLRSEPLLRSVLTQQPIHLLFAIVRNTKDVIVNM